MSDAKEIPGFQILVIRQKSAFLRNLLVLLYPKSHFSDPSDLQLPMVSINMSKCRQASRFPQYHKYLTLLPFSSSGAPLSPATPFSFITCYFG